MTLKKSEKNITIALNFEHGHLKTILNNDMLLSFLLSFLNKLQTDVLHINKDKMMEQNKDSKR